MPTTPPPHPASQPPPKAGGLAIASLVCSILGFFPLVCIGSLAGLIMGIIALIKAKPGQPKGMAIAGTVLGGAGIMVTPIILLTAILVPVLARARQVASNTRASANAINISQGAVVYAAGNKNWYPGWDVQGKRAKGDASGLAHLLVDDLITPGMLTPPGRELEAFPAAARLDPAQLDAWCRRNSDFIFLPDFKPTTADQDHARIEVFADPDRAADSGKIPVVRGDSSAEFLSKEDLDAQLEAQYGAHSAELALKWRLKQERGH